MRSPKWLVAVLLLLVPACGFSSAPSFQIGLKRVALDLSFKDESKALPPIRRTLIIPEPAPSDASFVTQVAPSLFPTQSTPSPTFVPPKLPPTCPTAPPNSHPLVPATVFVYDAPAPGSYTTHNTGTFSITGAISLKAAYPPQSLFNIGPSKKTTDNSNPANGPTTIVTYDVIQNGVDGSSTTTTYRTTYSPSPALSTVEQEASQAHAPQGELDLIKIVTTNSQGKTTFTPTPPVEMMEFKSGQGTSWNSAGIDQATGTSMVVQGKTTRRALVDICGTVYDTYEVVSTEKLTNLRTGFTSTTNPSDPNIYDIATQYGGLFVHEHIDTTTQYTAGSTPVLLTQDYDATLNSIKPLGSP